VRWTTAAYTNVTKIFTFGELIELYKTYSDTT